MAGHELLIIKVLDAQHSIDGIVRLDVQHILDGTALRILVALGNLIALLPVATSLLRKK